MEGRVAELAGGNSGIIFSGVTGKYSVKVSSLAAGFLI